MFEQAVDDPHCLFICVGVQHPIFAAFEIPMADHQAARPDNLQLCSADDPHALKGVQLLKVMPPGLSPN